MVAGVLAEVLEALDVDRSAAVEVTLEETVNHHVGVTADGRGEVGIVVEGQSVVTDVVGGVYSLSHGADGEGGEKVFLAFALDVDEHAIEGTIDVVGVAGCA